MWRNKFLSFILLSVAVIPLWAQKAKSLEKHDHDWLVETLGKSCKYPVKLQEKNQEGILRVAYEVNKEGHITRPKIVQGGNRKFKKAALDAFKAVMDIATALPTGKDTLQFQFKLNIPTTLVHPRTDVLVIGYSSCDTPVLMR